MSSNEIIFVSETHACVYICSVPGLGGVGWSLQVHADLDGMAVRLFQVLDNIRLFGF